MSIEAPLYQQQQQQQQQQQHYQTTIITTNSFRSNENESYVIVNVKELNLKIYNEIIVSWYIHEDTSIHDWIGLYRSASLSNADHLDVHKLYSFNAAKIGHLTWSLDNLKLRNTTKIDDNDYVEFRYYNGSNNRLVAKSSSLKFVKYKIENELITCKITEPFQAQDYSVQTQIEQQQVIQQIPLDDKCSNDEANINNSTSSSKDNTDLKDIKEHVVLSGTNTPDTNNNFFEQVLKKMEECDLKERPINSQNDNFNNVKTKYPDGYNNQVISNDPVKTSVYLYPNYQKISHQEPILFKNSMFQIKFDLPTPRAHLIILFYKDDKKVSTIRQLDDEALTSMLSLIDDFIDKFDLKNENIIFSYHTGCWSSSKHFHAHLVLELDKYIELFNKHVVNIDTFKPTSKWLIRSNKIKKQMYVDNVIYNEKFESVKTSKKYQREDIKNIHKMSNERHVQSVYLKNNKYFDYTYDDFEPKLYVNYKQRKPNENVNFILVRELINLATYFDLFTKKSGCHLCFNVNKNDIAYLRMDAKEIYFQHPKPHEFYENFKNNDKYLIRT